HPRCVTLADVHACDLPGDPAGDPHRVRARARARTRRIRFGRVQFRQHAHEDGDRSASHRDQARAVRLRGRDGHRRGDARRLVRAVVRRQPAAEVGTEGRRVSGTITNVPHRARSRRASLVGEGPVARALLIATALGFLGSLLVAPVVTVFTSAFARGFAPYLAALADPETLSAIRLTLLTAGIVVPL